MRQLPVLLLACLVPLTVLADDHSWFVGVGGFNTNLKTRDFGPLSGITSDVVDFGEFSDDQLGWQVFGSYMFSKYFGVMAKYSDSGDFDDKWSGFIEMRPDLSDMSTWTRTDFDFEGKASLDGVTFYLLQTVPLSNNFEFTLEVGWTQQDLDFEWDTTGFSDRISDDDSGIVFGAVVRYKFLEHWAVSSEFEYINIDFGDKFEEPIRYGLNLEYHF